MSAIILSLDMPTLKILDDCLFSLSRIGENLEQSLPNLKELVLTSNNIQELVSTFQQQQKHYLHVQGFCCGLKLENRS